jgi:hypothetical protein
LALLTDWKSMLHRSAKGHMEPPESKRIISFTVLMRGRSNTSFRYPALSQVSLMVSSSSSSSLGPSSRMEYCRSLRKAIWNCRISSVLSLRKSLKSRSPAT